MKSTISHKSFYIGAAVVLLLCVVLISMHSTPPKVLDSKFVDTSYGRLMIIEGYNVDVEFIDSIAPLQEDKNIVLAVAGAFTGQRLDHYDSFNICGNYVTNGVAKHGYPSKYCTGYFATYSDTVIIGVENIQHDKKLSIECGGNYFQQLMLVHNGDTLQYMPFKSSTLYRALALLNGNVCIIQTSEFMTCKAFSKALVELGVTEALYLDMGGWGWGWMRNDDGSISDLNWKFNDTKYQTNWVVLKKRKGGS